MLRALVAVLRPLVAQIATLRAAVEHAVDAHPDGKIATSLFRKGRVCAATLLAEDGDDRARFVSGGHRRSAALGSEVTREQRAVTFAGLATCACARRSSHSLPPRARGPAQAPEAASAPTRFASSPVPGVACAGPAGRSEAYDPTQHRAARQLTRRLVDQEAA